MVGFEYMMCPILDAHKPNFIGALMINWYVDVNSNPSVWASFNQSRYDSSVSYACGSEYNQEVSCKLVLLFTIL